MPKPTPFDFFAAFYPDPIRPGRLALRTRTHRAGTLHTSWCSGLREVARLVQKYRNTRDLRFGPALHEPRTALAIARQRRKRATLAMVRGIEASVTAVPALWAEILLAGPGRPADLPPDRRAALALLTAVPRPSIVAETRRGVFFCWLLRELWVLESDADRRLAKTLLRRVQWALESAAAQRGWRLPPDGDLARMLSVPAELERFPLAPGEDRYRRRDFGGLEDAPPIEQGDWPPPREEPSDLSDVRLVRGGCPWLDACFEESATLERKKYRAAMTLLAGCGAPGAGPWELAHELSRAHPSYDEFATDEELRRALCAPHGPRTCRFIAHRLGALDDYCSGCPSYGRIESPVDLGRRPDAAAPAELRPPDALLAGLDDFLPRLGGSASARQIVEALARGDAPDLPLRRALERLFAHLGPGDLPSPRLLGCRLRALAGHVAEGLTLVEGPKTRSGIAWSVRRAEVAAGAAAAVAAGAGTLIRKGAA